MPGEACELLRSRGCLRAAAVPRLPAACGKYRLMVPARLPGQAARADGQARTWPRTVLWAGGPGRSSWSARWARPAAAGRAGASP